MLRCDNGVIQRSLIQNAGFKKRGLSALAGWVTLLVAVP